MLIDKNKKYKIGTLIKDEDPLNRNPSFSPRKPNPVILSTQQLNEMGCKSLQDFLTKNPYGLPKDRAGHAYEVANGEYEYFDEGMPLGGSTGLDDDGKTMNFLVPNNNDKTSAFFERQVKSLEADKKALEAKLETERVMLHAKESEWIEKERNYEKEVVKLETKVSAFEELIKGVNEGKALSDGGKSWGQQAMSLLNGPIGNALAHIIAENKSVQNSFAKLINAGANLVPDEEQPNGMAQQAQPQQQPTRELNNPIEQI